MPLTDFEVRKVTEWLKAKGVHGACAACGRKAWGLGEIVSSPVSTRIGPDMSAEHIPMVTMVCGHCSYIMYFSAKLMGLR